MLSQGEVAAASQRILVLLELEAVAQKNLNKFVSETYDTPMDYFLNIIFDNDTNLKSTTSQTSSIIYVRNQSRESDQTRLYNK